MAFCRLYSLSLLLVLVLKTSQAQLSASFYATTCPKAIYTIRTTVANAVAKEHRMGASLLRLHFHDCFVNGCDGSVLLDDTSSFKGEKTAGANVKSIRGFEVIDEIKTQLENICPGVVSCADVLAVAARDSVAAQGGPSWPVQLGRRDSTTASLQAANSNTNIPSPAMDLTALLNVFTNKGFTAKEMVALIGSHTIGQARCLTFRNRIYNESLIDASFATSLKNDCPITLGDDNLTALDSVSPNFFDNSYYKNLLNNQGLLHSDQQLFSGGSTDPHVTSYGKNFISFFVDFATAMIKMGNLSVLTGTTGQVRTDCRKVNS